MNHVNTRRIVKYNSDKMFDLVADIESYPQFVPLCKTLTIKSREQLDDKLLLVSEMTVGYMGIHESLTTQVLLQKSLKKIDVQYINGPFHFLNNYWDFKSISDNSCEVIFYLEYELKNRLFNALIKKMFDHTFRVFVEAFEKRAQIVYGSSVC
ncbi:Putative oligoketide cyclase/dehydratase or lipid transport protein YfjG [Liberibacter crescens BT-1]|uniref:Putative oligoketide cyclase/dehydratase or lipid transport protein YfjG n=1 Tax=Liberibacter crescens (strain BT-1) TaxID=1215343 RepID=L0EWS8_LIBCB|nr:ubiquinone-binding protein [Liberibacter crescens]AGA65098.1 Putative oligoketide cyclase/dehydratase or lipid transport protein YfjG [Liberibacter crescens BT-1]AMC13079.1 cyclase [Liberibacter crescens]